MLTNITIEKILSSHKLIYTIFHSQRISSVNNITRLIPAPVAWKNMFVFDSKPGHAEALHLLTSDNST